MDILAIDEMELLHTSLYVAMLAVKISCLMLKLNLDNLLRNCFCKKRRKEKKRIWLIIELFIQLDFCLLRVTPERV